MILETDTGHETLLHTAYIIFNLKQVGGERTSSLFHWFRQGGREMFPVHQLSSLHETYGIFWIHIRGQCYISVLGNYQSKQQSVSLSTVRIMLTS
jgi:hypothetical protein